MSPPSPTKQNWFRRLYHWTLSWSEKPQASAALGVISFTESSFFPIPPDVLLMPMCFAKPSKWLHYAALCTAASVLGAVFGWYIGAFLWSSLDQFFYTYVPKFTPEIFSKAQLYFNDNAFLAIAASAFTPVPFKIFTIAAGVFNVSFLTLIIASILGRGARFFMVAAVIRYFGPAIKPHLEKYLEIAAIALFLLGLLGFWALGKI